MKSIDSELKELASYDPSKLFDEIILRNKLKNDWALAHFINIAPPAISKIRSKSITIGASLLIKMHETTNMSIGELRALMGDTRQFFHPPISPYRNGGRTSSQVR